MKNICWGFYIYIFFFKMFNVISKSVFFLCLMAKLQTCTSLFQINSKSTSSVVVSNASPYVLHIYIYIYIFFFISSYLALCFKKSLYLIVPRSQTLIINIG